MEQTMSRNTLRRLHIGGLTSKTTVEELKEKFNSFGTIQDVEIKTKKDGYGDDFNTFAYIDIISDESAVNKCFSIFNKAKWKGRSLQIHLAKEHFLKRLDEERKCPIIPVEKKVKTNFHNPLALIPEVEDFNMKGKVPGTPIPGEKKWVVGKYGRILPIVNVRNRSLNKCIYYDPSKYCHNLKKLKVEEENERLIDIDELTWTIETDSDTNALKRRCGDFSGFEGFVPKRVKLNEDYWSEDMQEKMEELRRRYLEKKSEEIPKNLENDIEIVKSGKKVSSDYHIPKTDFIYGSDEELFNDEKQFQDLSVLGEPTSCGYDSVGSADTDEIIAMNTSRNKTSSSKNSIATKEQISPLKKPEVNEIDSETKIDQVVTVGDKLTSNSILPLKEQHKLEITVSYVDNKMKQIPFQGIAMLDLVSTETVPKAPKKSESDSESDTNSVSENLKSFMTMPNRTSGDSDTDNSYSFISKLKSKQTSIPSLEHITNSGSQHCENDSEYDSDDFEKVALKYSDSLSVFEDSAPIEDSDLKLEIIKTDLQEKNDSYKMLTASYSEDTDDLIKKQKNTGKTTKSIITSENYSDETVKNIRNLKNNDTCMPSNIPTDNVIPTDSDLDSDDFEKVGEKYSSFMKKNTTPSPILNNPSKSVDVTTQKSKIISSEIFQLNDEGSSSESDIEIVIKDKRVKAGKTLNRHTKESIKIPGATINLDFNDTKNHTTENSKISHDIDDGDDDDDDSNVSSDKSHNINKRLERNKTECRDTDNENKSIEDSKDDAEDCVQESDEERMNTGDEESSNEDNSDSNEESDSDDPSDSEDASETNNGDCNKHRDDESSNDDNSDSGEESEGDDQSEEASETNNDDDNKQGDEETHSSDSKESDDNDDSDKDSDEGDGSDTDDDDDDSDKDGDDDHESEDDEENKDGNEDSKDEEVKEDECQRNKNFFVSSSLFSAFVKPDKDTNSGFSFLKTFANKNIPEPKKLELPRNLRKKEDTVSCSDKSDEIEEKQTSKSPSSFFFQHKDIRLQEGVQFFHRKMDIDEIEDKWNEVKPVFLATCRQRNRLALKRLEQEKLKKRKMSYTTSFVSKNRK